MLKGSRLVGFILAIVKDLNFYYEASFTHKIFAGIGQGLRLAFAGSCLGRLSRTAIDEGYFSRCISKVFEGLNRLSVWLNPHLTSCFKASFLYRYMGQFKDGRQGTEGLGLTLLIGSFAYLILRPSRTSLGLLGLSACLCLLAWASSYGRQSLLYAFLVGVKDLVYEEDRHED